MDSSAQPVLHLKSGFLYVTMPLLLLALGNYPERAISKELLSGITIVAFCLLTGQFYWTSRNRFLLRPAKINRLTYLHKVIGYSCIGILLIHPFLLVLPHSYAKGISPVETFFTVLTTTTSRGVIFGIIGWLLALLIGLTSIFRKNISVKYTTWLSAHKLLAIFLIVVGTLHAIDLGRHSNLGMSMLLVVFAGAGLLLCFPNVFPATSEDKRIEE